MNISKQSNLFLFIIAILIGLNNIIIGYKIAGISLDRLFELLIFFLLFKTYLKELKDENLRFLNTSILFLFALLVLKYFVLLINNETLSFSEILRPMIRILTNAIFIYLCYYLFKRDKNKINIILIIYFLAFFLAFLQNPSTPLTEWAQHIKLNLFSGNMQDFDIIYYKAFLSAKTEFMRVTGPYGQTITLSYALVVAAILSTYMYVESKKNIYLYNTFFIFIVSIMTLTRSAVIAILIMIIFIFKKNKSILFLIMIIGLLIYLTSNLDNLDQFSRVVSKDESSDGKILLVITGIITLILHPIGATESQIMEIREWMYSMYHNTEILKYPPHNGLINYGFEYTTFAYIILIAIFIHLFKISRVLGKEKKMFWFFSFLAYFIQQNFHNNGLFVSEFNVLIILSLYLIDIHNKHNSIKDINN